MRLVVRVSDTLSAGGRRVQMVRIAGELDGETYREAEKALAPVLAAAVPHVVLDLTDLTYVSSVGVGVLLDTRRRLEAQQVVVSAIGMRPSVERVFAIVQSLPASRLFADAAAFDEYIAPIQPLPKGRGAEQHLRRATVRIGERVAPGGKLVQVVRVVGELDSTNYREIEKALAPVLFAEMPLVNLDLADLTFLSSAGVGVLLDLRRRLEANKVVVTATGMKPSIERVFAILQVLPGSHAFASVAEFEAFLASRSREAGEP